MVQVSHWQHSQPITKRVKLTTCDDSKKNHFLELLQTSDFSKVDFTRTTLTHLLRDLLVADAAKFIVAHVSSEKRHLSETLFTLGVLNKAKSWGGTTANRRVSLNIHSLNEIGSGRDESEPSSESARDTVINGTNPLSLMVKNERHLRNLIKLYDSRVSQLETGSDLDPNN